MHFVLWKKSKVIEIQRISCFVYLTLNQQHLLDNSFIFFEKNSINNVMKIHSIFVSNFYLPLYSCFFFFKTALCTTKISKSVFQSSKIFWITKGIYYCFRLGHRIENNMSVAKVKRQINAIREQTALIWGRWEQSTHTPSTNGPAFT